METRYQGRRFISMITDHKWCLKRDCKSSEVAKNVKRRKKFMRHTNKLKARFSLNKTLLSNRTEMCAYLA